MQLKPSHKTIKLEHSANHVHQHCIGRRLYIVSIVSIGALVNCILTTPRRSTSPNPTNKPMSESDVPIPRHETFWEKVKHIVPFTSKGSKDGESSGGKAKV